MPLDHKLLDNQLAPKIPEDLIQKLRRIDSPRNDCSGLHDTHEKSCTGCIRVYINDVDELEAFLSEVYQRGIEDGIESRGNGKKEVDGSSHKGVFNMLGYGKCINSKEGEDK